MRITSKENTTLGRLNHVKRSAAPDVVVDGLHPCTWPEPPN